MKKQPLKDAYDNHHYEKELSKKEKNNDKQNKEVAVAVYDLQAVFQLPKGYVSIIYYSCKLNVLNLTVCDI